jgi:hypothetical protein
MAITRRMGRAAPRAGSGWPLCLPAQVLTFSFTFFLGLIGVNFGLCSGFGFLNLFWPTIVACRREPLNKVHKLYLLFDIFLELIIIYKYLFLVNVRDF